MPLPLGLWVCALVTFKRPFGGLCSSGSNFPHQPRQPTGCWQTPSICPPHLCGTTLLASCKKSGGHRPIAVGEVLRRLTSKCLASASRLSAISSLTPLQLDVEIKGSCEVIIYTTSHLLSSIDDPDQYWCLFLDFSNAFNCV